MTFLVVDDNHLVNRFVASYLREKGHSAVAFSDGGKAVEWIEANACDGAILDIGMPHIDGVSLISLVREKRAGLPIVMFTGMGYDNESMEAARKAGANAYVSKSRGPAEMYAELMRLVEPEDSEPAAA